MSTRPNPLLTFASLALQVAAGALPPYSHPKSPRKYTQPQLLACLLLKAHLKQSYRGIADLLAAADGLRDALGLARVPDHSTLQDFAARAVSPEAVDRLLAALLERVGPAFDGAAIDSTGMEPSGASAHYQARSGRVRKRYVKLSVAVLCGSLLPLGLVVSRGPCNDKREARELLERASRKGRPKRLLADKGYDAEWVHEFCHDRWCVASYIPAVIHRKDGTAGGRWRSRMVTMPKLYGQRWHVESYMSGLKRTTGSQLTARTDATLDAEASLRVLAYAVRR
jgi:hypothetical protein